MNGRRGSGKASQLTFLAPNEAEKESARRALLERVEENLALIREIAALYNLPRLKEQRPRVMGPGEAARLLAPEMAALEQEQLRVMVLNTRNEVLSMEMVYQGNVNTAIVRVVQEACNRAGMPEGTVQFIENTDRAMVEQMLKMNQFIDLIIPRGGAGLIKYIKENATMGVVAGGIGVCHTYIDDSADIEKAIENLKKAMEGDNTEEIKRLSDELTQASHKLAETMYARASQEAQAEGGGAESTAEPSKDEDVVDADFEEVNK